ncbi:DUF134 domain-containing protein [Candidatus Omnitrophota bacterium]
MTTRPRGRKPKIRYVKADPDIAQFSPRGKPGRPNEVELTVDQYEAIRLADYKQMPHVAAGKLMGISRQTFERVLKKARMALADGVVNGKIIKIEGGAYKKG